jgi:hypothetical protein
MSGRRERNRRSGEGEGGPAGLEAAMLSLGWVVPSEAGQVAQAEAGLPTQRAAPPASLRDARRVLDSAAALPSPLSLTPSAAPEDGAELARAAREGKPISDDVQERMRRDRQAAEDAAREPHDGEDVE